MVPCHRVRLLAINMPTWHHGTCADAALDGSYVLATPIFQGLR